MECIDGLRWQLFVRNAPSLLILTPPFRCNYHLHSLLHFNRSKGKADIWGESERRAKKLKKKEEAMEHGEFLSAIQRAVAEL